jgi:hypothetical protein
MTGAAPKKFSAMRYLRDRMVGLVVGISLFLVGLAVYTTYKSFFWPHVQAVVISVEPVCVYVNREGRRPIRERLSCGADSEAAAARLIAGGYKLERDREALLTTVYEVEPGRKSNVTLRSWWSDVRTFGRGSVVWIRYPSGSPDEAELVTGAEKAAVVFLGFLLGALLLACLIAVITYERDEQAASG